MAQWHLNSLLNKLVNDGFVIYEELDGNDYDISAEWVVCYKRTEKTARLLFEGLDDLAVLPIDKSYGVYLAGMPNTKAYISKQKPNKSCALKEWDESIDKLICELKKQTSLS